MEATAAIPLGKIVGTAIASTGVVPALGVGIVGFAVVGAMTYAIAKINEKRDESEKEEKTREGRTSIIRLSDKQIVEIGEAMTHAQSALEIEIKDADREQPRRPLVASGMRNAQHRTLKLYLSGSFSGKFVVPPPLFMSEGIGLFLHQGPDPHDSNPGHSSRGFVIYGTFDKDRPLLLYILGWSKPANGSPKVYVQAGLLPNMLKQRANDIEIEQVLKKLEHTIRQKLNELTEAHESSSYDPETGAEAAARIGNVFPGSNWALLGARFSRREH